eukprot:Phypoly_transcript_08067.p1 GENE.Phypoly_transcript_08067~~Phypoly_transcript_08067.p1  ORF type:complete len:491 (+),score=78.22 Phypoly_transcript_08067:42-1514(+)
MSGAPIKTNKRPLDAQRQSKKKKLAKKVAPTSILTPSKPQQSLTAAKKEKRNQDRKEPNSLEEGQKLLEWLIAPQSLDEFFENVWEQKHLVVKRNDPGYYSGIFTKDDIDSMLKEHVLKYTQNIDVTNYVEGERQTLNPDGRAFAPTVWKYYREGCSVRLKNPQTFHDGLWKMLATLQEYFGCFVGANTYLTPAGSQGFSPHYDDVEVFILQTEGSKHWKLYDPPTEADKLARESSPDYNQDDLGPLIAEVTLEAGDLLYLPRGCVHQAVSAPDVHSLHVTLSTYQHNAYIDLLEAAVPRALELAAEASVDFRKGLPKNMFGYMGVAYQDNDDDEDRQAFIAHMKGLWDQLFEHLPLDAAADKMGIKFQHEALPPVLSSSEASKVISGNDTAELNINREVRLIRARAIRVVMEDEILACYFHTENTRVYHEVESQVIEFTPDSGPALEYLLETYADGYVPVKSIPAESPEQQVDIANALYERGLLTVKPL